MHEEKVRPPFPHGALMKVDAHMDPLVAGCHPAKIEPMLDLTPGTVGHCVLLGQRGTKRLISEPSDC